MLLSESLSLEGQELLHLLERVRRLVGRHGRWGLWGHHLGLARLCDQTLGQRVVVKVGCNDVGWQVLVLSLGSVDLLSDDLALAAGARGHVKIGLVPVFDAHIDGLLLERDSVLVVTECADELLVDAEEAHDQGRVEDGADRHAPGHMVMFVTVVSLAAVLALAAVMALATVTTLSGKFVTALAFASFALAVAALLSFLAVLLSVLLAVLVKVTAAVALVNGGLRNVSQVKGFDSLRQRW